MIVKALCIPSGWGRYPLALARTPVHQPSKSFPVPFRCLKLVMQCNVPKFRKSQGSGCQGWVTHTAFIEETRVHSLQVLCLNLTKYHHFLLKQITAKYHRSFLLESDAWGPRLFAFGQIDEREASGHCQPMPHIICLTFLIWCKGRRTKCWESIVKMVRNFMTPCFDLRYPIEIKKKDTQNQMQTRLGNMRLRTCSDCSYIMYRCF